ncbi:kinase-like domain-containing protein [Mycena filopes]|nr:kinase-like domain-containing protein [Mycena filopes]
MKKIPRNNKRTENMNRLRANNPARSLAHPSLPRTADPTALVDRRGTEEAKIRKEIAIMKKCDHPNIIKFLSFIDDQMSANICLIMEYMEGGELQWQVDNEPYLTMDQTRRCMRDVVLGLQYLHLQGIIHRDIKPSNIMWTADRSHVKIGDFGVAHLVSSSSSPDGDEEEYDAPRHAGTPAFLAPEIAPGAYSPSTHSTSSASKATGQTQTQAKREEAVTPAVDLWALGVTLYCMLFGRMPFEPERGALGGGGVAAEASLYRAIRESPWGLPRVLKSGSAAGGAGAGASGSGVRDEWDDVWGSGPKDAKERREKASRDDDGEEEEVERVTTMCSNRVVIVPADWDKNGVLGSLGGLLQKDPRVRWGIEQVKVGADFTFVS